MEEERGDCGYCSTKDVPIVAGTYAPPVCQVCWDLFEPEQEDSPSLAATRGDVSRAVRYVLERGAKAKP